MVRFFARLLLPLLGLAMGAGSNARAAAVTADHLTLELVSEHTALAAGAPNWLGLRLAHEPEWHTYWINAGDTGLATKLEWTLPAGWQAGAIDWPAPQRLQITDLYNFGYSGEIVLPVAVEVPAAAAGSTASVRVLANWLVCKEECIPGKAELSLALPVVAAGSASTDAAAAALLRRALAQRPQVLSTANAHYRIDGDEVVIEIGGAGLPAASGLDVFPRQAQVLANAPARIEAAGDGLRIVAARSDYFTSAPAQLDLALVRRDGDSVTAWQVAARPQPGVAAGSTAATGSAGTGTTGSGGADLGTWLALLLALLGGLALNLMPCVFPVLSLKALNLVENLHSPAAARRDGLAYLAGTVAGFVALAAALLALRGAGQNLGWGFQMQSPVLVAALAYLMVALGLNLSGAFVLGARLGGVGQSLTEGSGARAAFFTGLLACIVATPCTAPFMGPAVGYALTQPTALALAIFAALGLGLALPIVALSFLPLLARFLPRPGAWMNTFKQLMAWPLYLTAVWLVWVLMRQAGADGTALVLLGLVVLIAALLLHGSFQLRAPSWPRRLGTALLLLLALSPLAALQPQAESTSAQGKLWTAWSAQRLDELRRDGKPVLVNMTAAWCITCLANERVALSSDAFAQQLQRDGIAYLKGDWTSQDAAITNYLAGFGRNSVPLYVLYPRNGGTPEVLPQLLTPSLVADALARAAAGSSAPPVQRSSP